MPFLQPVEGIQLQIVGGSPEEIAAGRGEVVVGTERAREILSQPGHKLMSTTRFWKLWQTSGLQAIGQVGKAFVFYERDVIALRESLLSRSDS
jgi:hypothetical protein